MKNVPDSKLGNLYRELINLILKKDIKGLLNQYSKNGVLISSFETENPTTLMIVEAITMQTDQGEAKMRFADSWVLDDEGKIKIHFAGMTQYPDGQVA